MTPAARAAALAALRERWGTAPGQTWRAGPHALHVADARDVAAPAGAATLVYDPPWDDAAAPVPAGPWASALVFTSGRHLGAALARFGTAVAWQFVWDCQACHARTGLPFQRHKSCLWYGDRGTYRWRGARLDPRPDGRAVKLADVYARPITTEHRAALHPHAKPLAWVRCLVGNCAAPGVVFDPFAGSGTTLLACAQTDRACVAVERDPGYAALVLERAAGAGLEARRG